MVRTAPGGEDENARHSAAMASDATTPLMRQYNSIKQQVPKALLMFRLGDFYELFYDDAVVAARELEITLTARNKEKGAAIPRRMKMNVSDPAPPWTARP